MMPTPEPASLLLSVRSTVSAVSAGSEESAIYPPENLLDLSRPAGSWRSLGTSPSDSWLLVDHGRSVETSGIYLSGGTQDGSAYAYRVRRSSASPLDTRFVSDASLSLTNYSPASYANLQIDAASASAFDVVATPIVDVDDGFMDITFAPNASALNGSTEPFHQLWLALRRKNGTGDPLISVSTRDTSGTWVLKIEESTISGDGVYGVRFSTQDVVDYAGPGGVVALRIEVFPAGGDTIEIGGVTLVPDYGSEDYDSGWTWPKSAATQISDYDTAQPENYYLSQAGARRESSVVEPYMLDESLASPALPVDARYTLIEFDQRYRFDRRGGPGANLSGIDHQHLDRYEFRNLHEGPARAFGAMLPGVALSFKDRSPKSLTDGGALRMLTYPGVDDDWETQGRLIRTVVLSLSALPEEVYAELEDALERAGRSRPIVLFVSPGNRNLSRIYSIFGMVVRGHVLMSAAGEGTRSDRSLGVEEL